MRERKWIRDLEAAVSPAIPCIEAIEWANNYSTPQAAWDACKRGDWMIWTAAKVGLAPERHKLLCKALCKIVERKFDKLPEGETRPQKVTSTLWAWTEGTASLDEVKAAAIADADDACAAADADAYAYARAVAAYAAADDAAAYEAYAAYAASYAAARAAAAVATRAARAARAAAHTADADAARLTEYAEQAVIIREFLTCPEL